MKFSHDLTYDAAPEVVLQMLADPAFRERVCQAMHTVRHDVTVDGSGAGMTVVVDQSQPTRGAPAFVERFIGDAVRIVRRESWQDVTHATLAVEVPGKPARIDGGIRLVGRDGSTVQTVSGNVEVRIPLVGGRVEDLVADTFRSALHAEERVGRSWLAGDR
ncbi:MAG TPA: DUF2505 domain-containing protein [Nocardioidaceae bacterium]|jgi:hypothetical protein|nr:DUF2505 domain-containing protein [Nocardioidaceae bacterium]